jgi:hypothetical protein
MYYHLSLLSLKFSSFSVNCSDISGYILGNIYLPFRRYTGVIYLCRETIFLASMDSPCGCRVHRVIERGTSAVARTCDPGVGLRGPFKCALTLTSTACVNLIRLIKLVFQIIQETHLGSVCLG